MKSPAPPPDPLWAQYHGLRSLAGFLLLRRHGAAPYVTAWSLAARNGLVMGYAYLSEQVVIARWGGKLKKGEGNYISQEEMVGAGLAGVVKGVETFDPGRGTRPTTHIGNRVWRAVQDELRRLDVLTRRDRLAVNRGEKEENPGARHVAFSEMGSNGGVGDEEGYEPPGREGPTPEFREELKRALVEAFRGFTRAEIVAALLRDVEQFSLPEVYRVLGRKRVTPKGAPGWVQRIVRKSPFLLR